MSSKSVYMCMSVRGGIRHLQGLRKNAKTYMTDDQGRAMGGDFGSANAEEEAEDALTGYIDAIIADLRAQLAHETEWRDATIVDLSGKLSVTEYQLAAKGQGEVRCAVCGSDEPRTGTCGSDDPRALCNLSAPASAQLADLPPRRIDRDTARAYMEESLWAFIECAGNYPSIRPDERIWPHVLAYAPAGAQPAQRENTAPALPQGWEISWDAYSPPDTIRLNNPKWGGCFLRPPEPDEIGLHALAYRLLRDMLAAAPSDAKGKADAANAGGLTVWEGPMPESNGKSNFTAVLHRKDSEGFDIFTDGFQFARSEYPDRVRYEADFMRWLIGERETKPDLWDDCYDMDKHSGYVPRQSPTTSVADAKDAARYRFMAGVDVPSHSSRWQRWNIEYWQGYHGGWTPLVGTDLDEAIDAQIAAMAAAPSSAAGKEGGDK